VKNNPQDFLPQKKNPQDSLKHSVKIMLVGVLAQVSLTDFYVGLIELTRATISIWPSLGEIILIHNQV